MQLLGEGSSHPPPGFYKSFPWKSAWNSISQQAALGLLTLTHIPMYVPAMPHSPPGIRLFLKAKTSMENMCQVLFSFLFCFPTEEGGKCKLLTSASSFLFLECISLFCPFAHAS